MTIDLNADMGESFGAYVVGSDESLLGLVSSVNIACGWHAGDPRVMAATVAGAAVRNVSVGAHPGYPDLQGFGRRSIAMSPAEIRDAILYQLGALHAFVRAAGTTLNHVKPHGALYNDAAQSAPIARAIAEAVASFDPSLVLYGLPASESESAARAAGLTFAGEFFADRAYREDGCLVPRREPGAVIHDAGICVRRTMEFVRRGTVVTASGKTVTIRASSVCLHGDSPEAVDFARNLRTAFREGGVDVVARRRGHEYRGSAEEPGR